MAALVVGVTGARGAGKTSVAAELAEVLDWRLICAEWVASALFGLAREGFRAFEPVASEGRALVTRTG